MYTEIIRMEIKIRTTLLKLYNGNRARPRSYMVRWCLTIPSVCRPTSWSCCFGLAAKRPSWNRRRWPATGRPRPGMACSAWARQRRWRTARRRRRPADRCRQCPKTRAAGQYTAVVPTHRPVRRPPVSRSRRRPEPSSAATCSVGRRLTGPTRRHQSRPHGRPVASPSRDQNIPVGSSDPCPADSVLFAPSRSPNDCRTANSIRDQVRQRRSSLVGVSLWPKRIFPSCQSIQQSMKSAPCANRGWDSVLVLYYHFIWKTNANKTKQI